MKLLSFEEIQEGLDREFAPLEPMLTGYRLREGGLDENSIYNCESVLSVSFTPDFRRLISIYDFGSLTIGPIVFCVTGNYSGELTDYNENVVWWGNGQRPSNLIMIANSDPYAILLDVDSGAVFAMDSELGWQDSVRISESFEGFFRGVGTVILRRNETDDKDKLAQSVHVVTESQNLCFWINLAK